MLKLMPRTIVVEALERLDRTLDALSDRPASEPIALTPDHDRETPILRGTVSESDDWTRPGDAMVRYETESGPAVIFNAPTDIMTPTVRARLYDLLVAVGAAASQIARSSG